jgi:sortase A
MRSKISLQWSLIIVGIAGIAVAVIVILFHEKPALPIGGQALQNPINSTSIESIQSIAPGEQANVGLPVRLKIPKINVDAAVEYVGLASNGAMDVPKGAADVAWFDPGPRPGEKGSAVIAGHEGWKNGIPAVFDDLHTLQQGDKLYIEDEKGATTAFVVRELRIYGENEDASGVFGSSDGKAHLNLITCEGVWNTTRKSYSDRLVVFADKEME